MTLARATTSSLTALFLALVGITAPAPAAEAPLACDVLFAAGKVVDGTGAPWFRADVCIVGDRIAAVGKLEGATAHRRIDASRLVVAPGFIDMMGQSEYNLLVDSRAASKITQGITTEVTGEGSSIAPLNARMIEAGKATYQHFGYTPTFTTLAGYFEELERRGSAVNLATFVGAGGVRDFVIGQEDRPPTPQELEAMKAAVAQAMEEGALGLSSSLIYIPDHFASTEELIELAKVAARYGGSYITHMRDEGDDNSIGIDAAMAEVFRIAREVPIPAEIYHIKASGRRSWGRMPEMLAKIERARAEGLDVSADQYPWAASSNSLDASLPVWVREGGTERMLARLGDPGTRKKARADFLALPENEDWPAGAARILVTSVLKDDLKHYEGMTIDEIAKERGTDPLEALMDLVVADRGSTARVTFGMSEEDVRAALRHPLVSFCTDSGARAEDGIFSKQKTHPRAFGSATRILGHYVREQKVLPIEEAVRKMTSLPAARMHLDDRGVLRPGLAADVVAFDPETVRERSTFADPLHYSEGMPYVMVNGRLVVDEGKITDARPGRVLRGPGYRRLPGR
jgi:dihydroorotase/N-acyl-D-amino-acid deacylase